MNLFHPTTELVLSLLISLFVPLLSSLLTRAKWGGEVTGLITLALSTLNGFLTEWSLSSDSHHYDWRTAAGIALTAYVVAVIGRVALWANTETDRKLLGIGSKTKVA